MSARIEVSAGIDLMNNLVRVRGCSLSHRQWDDSEVYGFRLVRDRKSVDFTLSEDFLAAMPNAPAYREHAEKALSTFAKRLCNAFPSDFYSKLGIPLSTEIRWPVQEHPSRDIVWLKVNVTDTRFPNLIAKTCAVIDLGLDDSVFEHEPFGRIEAVVNAIRVETDRANIEFYEPDHHPDLLQEISIMDLFPQPRLSNEALQQFLRGKIFWLGFKKGDQRTPVWVADPWDASYLGVSTVELVRAAQTVKAQGWISLSEDQEFATANDALIMAPTMTQSIAAPNHLGFTP